METLIFDMPYDDTLFKIELPKSNVLCTLEQKHNNFRKLTTSDIEISLNNPINSKSLSDLLHIKKPNNIVIVVNDITRPTPYKSFLQTILNYIESCGFSKKQITLLIATGIHRPNSHKENIKSFGEYIANNYNIINHNPDADLEAVGTLSDGQTLIINKYAAQSDFLITTGQINLHYFAGFSGGRKSILPGIASRKMITENHARMNEPGSASGSIENNPVHKTMIEAATLASVDFNINVVLNDKKDILSIFSGDLESSWFKGVELSRSMSTTIINEKADVTIASAGGFPKDINLYQAQKAIEHAAIATKSGGYIVLFASCKELYGEEKFEQWITETNGWDEVFAKFEKEFELGGHKAFALARSLYDKTLFIITDMSDEVVSNCNMIKIAKFEEALDIINSKEKNWKCYIMPDGSSILPVIGGNCND